MTDYIERLNSSQRLPVMDTEGAVLVIAGAGSGKTRVLTTRIAHLVNDLGVNPANILAITFTNKAADEMKTRLEKMIDGADRIWASTIHSMCVRILRANISAMGFSKNFSIYDDDDKERAVKRIILDMGLEADKYLKKAKDVISNAKCGDFTPTEYKDDNPFIPEIEKLTEIFIRYNDYLKKCNALDFDDLLIYALRLFEDHPEVLEYYSEKFRYVHVDEFQDTNAVQFKIVKMLASAHKNIFVVGDDDQSIYGWRGAKIANILDFEKSFKGARVYKLEQNYRSTKNILNVANLVIKNNDMRKKKTLWTDNDAGLKPVMYVGNDELDEAQFVALNIKAKILNGARASDFAVLMRINALSRTFEQEFLKYNVPYKVYGGFKFFDRKEIKDLTAYLRVIENPRDNESLIRIINVPRRGIGEKTVAALREQADAEGISLFDEIVDYSSLGKEGAVKNKIAAFKSTVTELVIDSVDKNVAEIIKNVIAKTDFLSQFEEQTEENLSKRMNVDELVASAEEFVKTNPTLTLTDYLSSITLSSDVDDMDSSNFVTVATIHAVKGLEFKYVYVVGLDETIIPSSRACNEVETLEEERRLMYVAVTRAEKELTLTRARSRYLYGERRITEASRFLKEVEPLLDNKSKLNDYPTYGKRDYSGYGGSKYGNNNQGVYGSDSYGSGGRDLYRDRKSGSRSTDSEFGYYADEAPAPKFGGGAVKSFSSGYSGNKKVEANAGGTLYKQGQTVEHQKFGVGTVIAVRNDESGQKVDVAFKSSGIKTLAAKYAPMKVV